MKNYVFQIVLLQLDTEGKTGEALPNRLKANFGIFLFSH